MNRPFCAGCRIAIRNRNPFAVDSFGHESETAAAGGKHSRWVIGKKCHLRISPYRGLYKESLWLGRSTPFHFLHDHFIVGQHLNAKSGNIFALQPRHETRKRRVQGGNAFRETKFASKEPPDDVSRLALVYFHCV